ncbi:MAG: patatin-like phospholipase family protein [Micavibrio sp.]
MHKKSAEKRTLDQNSPAVFMLYVPGGGVLGAIPAVVMARLEELLETPLMEAFHGADGVSVGAILVAALNTPDPDNPLKPKYSAADLVETFCTKIKEFFPPMNGRLTRMFLTNTYHTVRRFIDPEVTDRLRLEDMKEICQKMRDKSDSFLKPLIDSLEQQALQKWTSTEYCNKVCDLCNQIKTFNENLENECTALLSHAYHRTEGSSALKNIFKRSVLRVGDYVNRHWGGNYLYDANYIKESYRQLYGENRMSDLLRSTYIATFDSHKNRKHTFLVRKNDLLDISNQANDEVSANNHLIIDAVMASSAHPMAVEPHETEDGMICTDPAVWHAPTRSVLDMLRTTREKYPDAHVKLVVLGTGEYLGQTSRSEIKERMTQLGVAGNIVDGYQLSQIQAYVMGNASDILKRELGEENIIEINPRLMPTNHREQSTFPSRDVLDTSDENLGRVMAAARRTLVEKDTEIRNLARMIAENMKMLGHISEDKYEGIMARINTTMTPPLQTGIGLEIPDIFDRIMKKRSRSYLGHWFKKAAINENRPDAGNELLMTDKKISALASGARRNGNQP